MANENKQGNTEAVLTASPSVKKTVIENPIINKRFRLSPYPSFVTLRGDAKKLRDEVTIRLGSFYKKNSSATYKPLTREELTKFAERIFGISPNDPNFGARMEDYFCEYSIKLDIKMIGNTYQSIEIVVPFQKNEKGELVEIITEDSIFEVMKYRWCLNHPDVAVGFDQVSNIAAGLYKAYLEDIDAVRDAKLKANENKRLADVKYVNLTASGKEAQVDTVLSIYKRGITINGQLRYIDGLSPFVNLDHLSKDDKALMLREAKELDVDKFIEIVSDSNLDNRSLLYELLSFGIIQLDGNAYLYGNVAIGTSENQALAFLKDKGNAADLAAMKANLESTKETTIIG